MDLTDFQKNALTVAGVGLVAFFVVRQVAPGVVAAVNPADERNVVNQAANATVQAVSPRTNVRGEPLSIGDRIFAWFNPEDARRIGLIE